MRIVVKKEQERTSDKLFNFRPALFAAIFLCLGILFGYLRCINGIAGTWRALLLPVLSVPVFLKPKGRTRLLAAFAACLLCISFVVGEAAFVGKLERYTNATSYNGTHVAIGRIVDKERYDASTKLTLSELKIDGKKEEGKLVVYVQGGEDFALSDVYMLKATICTNVALTDEYGFAAGKIGKDIRFEAREVESCVRVGERFDLFLFLRERLMQSTYTGMDVTPASVTIAVLTGNTSGIEDGLLKNVRYGGIAHIFAVSGLHVGALYAFVLTLVKKTKLQYAPKYVRFLALAAILVFYAGLCGFSASVLRATVICLVAYGATLIGTETDFLQSLGVAAIVVLLLSPTALFEVGFQLSFLACLGLALLTRPIRKLLNLALAKLKRLFFKNREEKPIDRKRENKKPPSVLMRMANAGVSFLSATLAAQLVTLPLQIRTFGYVSGWSLALNCLFVPLISAGFSVVLLFVLISCLLPSVASVVLLYPISTLWSGLLLLFESVDLSTFAMSMAFPISGMLFYYVALLFTTDKWNIEKGQKRLLCIAAFLIFGLTMVVTNI